MVLPNALIIPRTFLYTPKTDRKPPTTRGLLLNFERKYRRPPGDRPRADNEAGNFVHLIKNLSEVGGAASFFGSGNGILLLKKEEQISRSPFLTSETFRFSLKMAKTPAK
jgi:hypothetical protein